MKLLNELRSVTLLDREDRKINALVQVRGFDATNGRRGATYQTHTPVAIVVSGPRGVTRLALPQPPSAGIIYAAAPIAYLLIRLFNRKGTK